MHLPQLLDDFYSEYLLGEHDGFLGRQDVLVTYLGFSLSSVAYSVTWTIYGDTNVHAEDANVRVVSYAWNFNVLFQAESKIASVIER